MFVQHVYITAKLMTFYLFIVVYQKYRDTLLILILSVSYYIIHICVLDIDFFVKLYQ